MDRGPKRFILNTIKQAGYVPERYEHAPINSDTSSKIMWKPKIYSPNPTVYQRVSGYVRNENMSSTGTFSIEPISDIPCISVYLRVSGHGVADGDVRMGSGTQSGLRMWYFLVRRTRFLYVCLRPPVCRPPGCRLPPARLPPARLPAAARPTAAGPAAARPLGTLCWESG